MTELYSRDEVAEPLRQLGHALVWVSGRALLSDCARSGRWVTHPRDALRALAPGASAADVLTTMVQGNAQPESSRAIQAARQISGDLLDAPHLADEQSDVEDAASCVSEPEEADEQRDALEERAAGVLADTTELPEPQSVDPATGQPEVNPTLLSTSRFCGTSSGGQGTGQRTARRSSAPVAATISSPRAALRLARTMVFFVTAVSRRPRGISACLTRRITAMAKWRPKKCHCHTPPPFSLAHVSLV